MPQPISNTTTIVSGSLLANQISYVVDGQGRNYRGGFDGLSWMSEVPAENNVIFIGNTTSIGRGPVDSPLFYSTFNNTEANVIYAVNNLPGSPGNLLTLTGAYDWAATNNFFINNSNNPIPRINADEMVLYVDANQLTSYPTTGNSWYDLSGNASNGTLTNGPTFDSNGWLTFDGVDDQVNISTLVLSGDFSITQTMNITTSNNGPMPVGGGNAGGGGDYRGYVWFRNSANEVRFKVNGETGPEFSVLSSKWVNKWISYTVTRSGNVGKLYINGVEEGSSTMSTNNFDIRSIGWSYNNAYLTTGDISKTLISNKALSTTEIFQNYYQAPIVTDGLVFAVDANNLVSYPKSGTTAYDLTGSNNGTLTNGVGYNNENGGSWVFDGVDDYITSTVTGLPIGASPRTINIWVKITGTSATPHHSICGYGIQGVAQTFDIGYFNNTGQVFLDVYGAGGIVSISTQRKNTWFMVTGIYTGAELQLYINGILDKTNIFAINTANSVFRIADTAWTSPDYLSGNVANTQIYNRALTADEVAQNYNATKDKFQGQQIVTNGLVLNLDSANKDSYPGTGTTWNDLSGNNNNGTLFNGTSWNPILNGGSMGFDGVDDYVSYPSLLNVGNTFTVNCWIKPTSKTRQTIVSDGYTYTINKGFFITCPGNNANDFFISLGQDQKIAISNIGAVTTGIWQMITARVNGASELIKLYVNGIETSYRTQTNADIILEYNTGVFTTGIRNGNSGDMLNSNIGGLQIYNRALSATEILQNYNATKTRFGL